MRSSKFSAAFTLLVFLLFSAVASAASVDECHSGFSAYAAVQPYILNPAVSGRELTTIVAVFEMMQAEVRRAVSYRFEVRSVETGEIVTVRRGSTVLVPGAHAEVAAQWDGRDGAGRFVADGEYAIEVIAELEDGSDRDVTTGAVARSSEVRVVVDRAGEYDRLFVRGQRHRGESLATSIDSAFPYQFFHGTTHAHTRWSDGGMPVSDCQSGRYGYAGGAEPVDAFNYAKSSGSIDFLAVVEHNHLMQEACSGCTAEQVKTRYVNGFNAAQSATVPGSFVGLFGMEWGVISGGGHINIYGQPNLMSWSGEPYHVLVEKSNYPQLYTAMKNNQGALGSYGTFNHPDSSDFGSWARSADGDAVMRGLSMVSGPAFNTSTSFSPGGSTYKARYDQALSYGWKIAPEAHQDNHCWNYGNSTPNRTVVLIPNGTTFNQQALLAAYNGRRFYAAQDRDVQLAWGTADGTRVMGDSFAASAGVAVSVSVADPAGEGVQKIEIWGGRAGTVASPGAAPVVVASNTAGTTLSAMLPPKTAGEEWYYYVVAVQADGNNIWSAPMWISWSNSTCTTPAAPSLSSPAAGATDVATSTTLSWGAVTGAASYDVFFGTGSSPAFYQTVTGTSLPVSSLTSGTTYSWKVAAKNSCGTSPASAVRSFTTASGGTGSTPISCGQSSSGTLATTDAMSTVRTTSLADVYTFDGVSGTPVTITMSSTAFDTWLVLKSPSGSVVAQDDDGNGGTNSKISHTPTTSGTFTIEATSYAANATGGYTIALTCSSAPVTLLSEGAESGAAGWTFTKNSGSGWSIETTSDSRSGAKRFKTNVGYSTYLNGADWSIVSPSFSLVGKSTATLTFYDKYKTESGYDFSRVEISTDGGSTWKQLRAVSGTSSGYPSWAPQVSLNLDTYAGKSNVRIRFRFTSDSSIADWGLAVDDIMVTAR